MSKKFPAKVYVQWESDANGNKFMLVHASPSDAAVVGERIKLGFYGLVQEVTVTAEPEVK